MEYLLALSLSAFFTVLYFYFKANKVRNIKSKYIKKSEIIEAYENELLEILKNSNPSDKVTLKIEFLKKVNQELALNIFFEKDEIKQVLEKLSKMEC